jgi:hypothetical protein
MKRTGQNATVKETAKPGWAWLGASWHCHPFTPQRSVRAARKTKFLSVLVAIVYWAIVLGFVVYLGQHLALGFNYIDDAAEMAAPQWMEWRAAFCLMEPWFLYTSPCSTSCA